MCTLGILDAFERPDKIPVSPNTYSRFYMKKTDRKSLHRQTLNLGDLIMTVSSCSKNNREMTAAVVDLLESGRVLVQANGHMSRAHVTR